MVLVDSSRKLLHHEKTLPGVGAQDFHRERRLLGNVFALSTSKANLPYYQKEKEVRSGLQTQHQGLWLQANQLKTGRSYCHCHRESFKNSTCVAGTMKLEDIHQF